MRMHPATVTITCQSKQILTCHITIPGGHDFYLTAVYASNSNAERTDLWCELIRMQHSFSLDTCPWVVCGDFNQIMHPSEHSDPMITHFTSDMLVMRDCMRQLELFDLRYQGSSFTWSNRQPADPRSKKLDRLLVNNHWLAHYRNSAATFLAPDFSDHTPCHLNLDSPLPLAGTKPFKFFNNLTTHPSFLPLVEASWIQAGTSLHQETGLSVLSAKQKILKRELLKLNNWCSLGNMSTYLEGESPRQVGIPRDATLASLWRSGSWHLPPARSERQVTFQLQLSLLTISPETYDRHNTGSIYSAITDQHPSVPWHKIVWFSRRIPKHSFLTWLFVLNRSPTRDRMREWGLPIDLVCVLCNSVAESRDHLFFDCPYSWEIWNSISHHCSHARIVHGLTRWRTSAR
ncbi:unnamed protein product [Thlaspi arvense]|uniref:Reverse transcriptase zinc-binding domain-containing protein n=1 Tax=Thlaspi arvense TaxID=13288 RepID=A0AAU9RES7_THLAR|nr:unnamed protein product [Thlaspi arvense]